jgi:large repetitive protein
MKQHPIYIITALLAVLLLFGCASALDSHITVSNVTMTNGGTSTATISMDSIPQGLSMYRITLNVADPAVAEISQVSYPAIFTSYETNGAWTNPYTVPFTSGYLKAASGMGVPDGSTNYVFATLTLHGLSAGTTTVNANIVTLDDNYGDSYILGGNTATIDSPTVTVASVPVANFAADTVTPTVGQTVTFTDQTSNYPTSWAWNFGDGATSTLNNPTHAYATTGYKTVTLIATNAAGSNTVTKTDYINVVTETPPVAAFRNTTPNFSLAPLSVTFADQSTPAATSWLWEYRASGSSGSWTPFASSTTQNPTQSFAAGAYDVRLTAINGGGSNVMTKTQYISASAGAKRLATAQSGTVSGDLYVGAFGHFTSGTSYTTNTAEDTFTVPAFTNVQWAKLYTVVYGSNADARAGTATVSFDGNGDGTYETVLGTETLATGSDSTANVYPVNNHVDKQYLNYQAQYDVTSLITSANPRAKVVTTPVASNFDGRINDIVLVVAYNDGDTDSVHYWVNEGFDFQTSTASAVTSTFATSSLTSVPTSATLKNIGLSSQDAIYTFNTNSLSRLGSGLPSFAQNSWDVKAFLTPSADSSFVYQHNTSSSYKTTLATLTARFVIPPAAAFNADKTTASTTDSIQFTDASTNAPTSWAWDFGDGTTSTLQNPTHTYATEGTKTVALTVTNAGGSNTMTKTAYINVVNSFIYFTPATQSYLPSETRTYEIRLNKAPQGLAGYDMYVSLSNSAVADITDVTFPSWAQMTFKSSTPTDSVRIRAVDSNQQIWPAAEDILLATITVRGTANGITPIDISGLNMDADGGYSLDATPTTPGEAVIGTYTGPVAAFTATPESGVGPLSVAFNSATSTGTITTYQWDFNNDGTIDSAAANPTFVYTGLGTYTAKLTVTGPGGSSSAVKTITVIDPSVPAADFSGTPTTGNFPLTVAFTDASSGNITTYAWDFDNNGIIDSYEKNPHKTYTIPGTYAVSLTVTGPGGADTETKTGYVTVSTTAPVANFIGNPMSGLAPLDVTFSDQSTGLITSWAWDFENDGIVDSTAQNPAMHTFPQGTYVVKLTVTGPGGSNSITKTVYSGSGLTADFSGTPTYGLASRNHTLSVAFTDNTAGVPTSWAWTLGNGHTSTAQNPTTTYAGRPTKFTVNLAVTNSGDTDSVTKTQYISITPYLESFPGYSVLPTDVSTTPDYVYEDINANGRIDYDDVVAIFNNQNWIVANNNVDIENYDYNFNGAIDFDDIVVLNDKILYS